MADQCPHRGATVTDTEGSVAAEYRKGRTDGPVRCTWYPGHPGPSPHPCIRPQQPPILDTILQRIGETPLVRINKLAKEAGLECDLLAKCEFFNAGGSVKDRIGRRMVEDAERQGRIKPGDVLIEPTSGNTGIGLALAAAIKGYRMIITMPEKMSQEKVDILKALGAEIIRTPTGAAWDAPESHISVANRLNKEIPNSHILDQYKNPSNPLAHYDETAEEILQATDGKVDMIVVGAGTGGTITGIARKLKERIPGLIVVGVDPVGSILAEPAGLNKDDASYQVEGIGYDFIPDVLDRSVVDEWIKCEDQSSFITARRLIREEGLFCGGSSGANMAAALKVAKRLKKGQRCVVVLPDSVRNYMTKFLNDDWLSKHGISDPEHGIGMPESKGRGEWWTERTVGDLRLPTPYTVSPTVSCKEAVDILAGEGYDQLPVVGDDNEILGVVTEGHLSARLMAGKAKPEDPVTKIMFKQFRQVSNATSLSDLAGLFDYDHFALVVTSQRCYGGGDSAPTDRKIISAVVTRIDMLKYITENKP